LRGALGVSEGEATVYSGIAVLEPEIFDWIPDQGPYSIIDALMESMRSGEEVGGLLAKEGLWIDLGTPSSYLEAHRLLADPLNRPSYLNDATWPRIIHPEAHVESGAVLDGVVSVGPCAVIKSGAVVRDSVIWPGSELGPEARIENCVVSGLKPVNGFFAGGVL
jgi:NDP-sugar pyrophosphorylase family protein